MNVATAVCTGMTLLTTIRLPAARSVKRQRLKHGPMSRYYVQNRQASKCFDSVRDSVHGPVESSLNTAMPGSDGPSWGAKMRQIVPPSYAAAST
jgi:hypothetical protein